MNFNKSLYPNIIAALIAAAGLMLEGPAAQMCLTIGLFALSGGITNWLAVHMLFERVPGLYGSGIIPQHFEQFKTSLLRLVTEELFNREHVQNSFATANASDTDTVNLDFSASIDSINFDGAFDQLLNIIRDSSLGSLLAMVGGEAAIEPLREPFQLKMKAFLLDTAETPAFQKALGEGLSHVAGSDAFMTKIESIVRARLDDLTPHMVKVLVKDMIHQHLGWLVVWGAVFGGLFGLITALLSQ